eukprot:Sspe_Gene.69278::Locus_40832_Transcript_1_1_Confidence_1.000_Length_1247::g.69278::m.69278
MPMPISPTRPFAGLAARLRAEPPAGALLGELKQQQESIEEEMRTLQVELNRALEEAGTHETHLTSPPSRDHRVVSPAVVSPRTVLSTMPSPRIEGYQSPHSAISPARRRVTVRVNTPSHHLPTPSHPASPPSGSFHGIHVPPVADRVWDQAMHHRPSSPLSLRSSEGLPGGTPNPVSTRRESHWQSSTKVATPSPHQRQLSPADRPKPLFTGPRPKSPSYFRRTRLDTEFDEDDFFAGGNVALSPGSAPWNTHYPSRRVGHPAVRTSRGRPSRKVRSRSPDMDLISRPPKYFDPTIMTGCSALGSACSPRGKTGAWYKRSSSTSLRTPLRGELQAAPTRKGGLWTTVPCAVREFAEDINASCRRPKRSP